MARIARVVAPGCPHHIVQRGNRRQKVFFRDSDYRAYLDLMAEWCAYYGVEVWAYCLLPNQVQLIVVPPDADALRLAIGNAHRVYTRLVNLRQNWRGHLWQGRFASYVLGDDYLASCARTIERNPVKARLVARPGAWKWSSAKAHIARRDDSLVRVKPLLSRVRSESWSDFLSAPTRAEEAELFARHSRTGRPLGDADFVERLEKKLGRVLRPLKRGPKPRKRK